MKILISCLQTTEQRMEYTLKKKRDSKAQDKDQWSIVQYAKTPTKELRFQLIEDTAML
jgi:hypothetical protein